MWPSGSQAWEGSAGTARVLPPRRQGSGPGGRGTHESSCGLCLVHVKNTQMEPPDGSLQVPQVPWLLPGPGLWPAALALSVNV